MQRLVVLALIGFAAQLVDGSLGMAYGVTSASLLLMFGIAPAIASASVHMAEVVTTAASGISHFRFGNVDKDMTKKLIIPGSIGAFLGAVFLSHLPGNVVKPYIAIFLFCLGVYVLIRFLFNVSVKPSRISQSKSFIPSLGVVAGFLDSTGGGGWGPLTTPVLLSSKKAEVRKVIGSVDTSEFAVAVSATIGFLISLGWHQINWNWVLALMAGGIVAAPLAAWIVRLVPARILGVLVGGIIILTNARVLMEAVHLSGGTQSSVYGVLVIAWLISIVMVWRRRNEVME